MALQADPLSAGEEDIHLLTTFIHEAGAADLVPAVFIRVMKSGSWVHWKNKLGKEVKPADFKEFVETKYPSGLGSTLDKLRRIVKDDETALQLFDDARKRQGERTDFYDNIIDVDKASTSGTSRVQALRRLKKDAPEIHAEVLQGELSPHAGMIKAGYRKRTIKLPEDPEDMARAIVRRLSEEDLGVVISILVQGR